MEDIVIIKKQYINTENKSDIVNVPNNLRTNFLLLKDNKEQQELLNAPITAMRIIFKILHDISYDQFQCKNGVSRNEKDLQQYTLFDNEFKTENNTFALFKINIKSIDKNRDYESIKKAMEFLENYKKGWYTSLNAKGKKIKSYGGFLTNGNISDGQINFSISSYWLENLVNMNTGYNESLMQMPWKMTNNKHFLFYLFIMALKDNFKVNFKTINERYMLNYSSANELGKGFLKPAKAIYDKYSNKSFNYNTKGENVYIVIYKPELKDKLLQEKTRFKSKINQKLHYFRVRHQLDHNNFQKLENNVNIDSSCIYTYEKAYSLMVKDYRLKKKKMTDITNNDFMTSYQCYIEIAYKNHSGFAHAIPNGFPRIN